MAEVLNTLRKIQKNRKFITVDVDGETIKLKRVDAFTYQTIMQELTDEMDNGKLSAAFSFEYAAKCVTRVIDGIELEEAKELLVSLGGIGGEFNEAVMQACGIKAANISDDMQDGDGGN